MKAQFKYAFLAGLYARGIVFAVITTMMFVFIVLGTLGLLPFAAQVTAVSLGGTAIAVMLALNIVGDVAVARLMYTAPGAYLHALTPAPRWRILLASVITMLGMDVVTMATVITGEVWMSFNLAGKDIQYAIWEVLTSDARGLQYILPAIFLMVAGYLLIMMVILFCVTVRKSLLYSKPAGGLLTAATALAVTYVISLTPLLLAPFGHVSRAGFYFVVTLGNAGCVLYSLLVLIQAAVLFAFTAKFMERKLNI